MKKDKTAEFLTALLFIWVTEFGLLFSLSDAFHIPFDKKTVYTAAILLGLLFLCILQKVKKHLKLLVLFCTLAAELVLYLTQKENLTAGLKYILNSVRTQIQEYVKNMLVTDTVSPNTDLTAGTLFFLIFISAAVSLCLSCGKRIWSAAVLNAAAFFIPFTVGQVPPARVLLCVAVTFTGYLLPRMGRWERRERWKIALLGFIFTGLSVFAGQALLEKPLKQTMKNPGNLKQTITSFWENRETFRFFGDEGVGGVNGGKLDTVGSFRKDDGQLHLEITVGRKPQNRIYLQGFTGKDYKGSSWSDARDSGSTAMLYEMLDGLETPDTMTIRYGKANRKFQYQPYGSSMYAGSGFQKLDRDSYSMKYFPYQTLEAAAPSREQTPEREALEDTIRWNYLEVGQQTVDAFQETANTWIIRENADSVAREITQLLQKKTSYSLSPGKTPAGKDYAEYFFFENKKGYCSHYATTAVLLFRMKGIPARYVSGYVAEAADFTRQEDGTYKAAVTGDGAHSWAEIYISGKGWLPVETTPGYSEAVSHAEVKESGSPASVKEEPESSPEEQKPSGAQNASSEPETETPSQETNNSPEEQTENTTGNGKENNTPDSGKTPATGLVAAASIVFIAAATVSSLLILRKRKNRTLKSIRSKDYNAKIRVLFHKIFRKLVEKKVVTADTELDAGFTDRFCRTYPEAPEDDIQKMLDIVYQANYGKEMLGKEEYELLKKIYARI